VDGVWESTPLWFSRGGPSEPDAALEGAADSVSICTAIARSPFVRRIVEQSLGPLLPFNDRLFSI
jgi:hypothetical protein